MFFLVVTVLMIFPHIRCGEVPEELHELGQVLHETCMQKSGVDIAVLNAARAGNFPDPEDEKLKCYIWCTYDEGAFMDEDGTVDVEALITAFPERVHPIYEPLIRECGTQRGKDLCDTAYKTHHCYWEQNNDAYFII